MWQRSLHSHIKINCYLYIITVRMWSGQHYSCQETSMFQLCMKTIHAFFQFRIQSSLKTISLTFDFIFQASGSTLEKHTATIILGIIRLIFTVIGCVLCRRCGRRPLTFISGKFFFVTVARINTSLYFFLN